MERETAATQPSGETSGETPPQDERKRRAKYRRARVRNFLFTIGPDRFTGGRIKQRHTRRDIIVREVELASPRWPAAFDGLRIGHFSDFHLGELLPVDRAIESGAPVVCGKQA